MLAGGALVAALPSPAMLRTKSSGAPSEDQEADQCSPSSSGTEASQRSIDDMFVRHKVHKLDTLAGLAVRYNVSVSDIKRSNGLLSDSAMYARDALLIPRHALPIGPQYSTWVGMIVTQYGRLGPGADSLVNSLPQFSPRSTTSIQQLRGYYSTGPSRSTTPQYESDGEDRHHLLAGSRGSVRAGGAWQSAREVELMTRSTAGASSAYADERLRRRRACESADGDLDAAEAEAGDQVMAAPPPAPGGSPVCHRPAGGGRQRGGGVSGALSHWQPGRWKEQVRESMKRAPSLPNMLGAGGNSGVLGSRGQALPAAASSGRLQQLQTAAQQALLPLQQAAAELSGQNTTKDSRKAD